MVALLRIWRVGLLALLLLNSTSDRTNAGESPHWIWLEHDRERVKSVCARKSFVIDELPEQLSLVVVADFTELEVYCNGRRVLQAEDYSSRAECDIGEHVTVGENILAIVARGSEGPSAFAAQLVLGDAAGRERTLLSNEGWLGSRSEEPQWQTVSFDDSDWQAMKSWGEVGAVRWQVANGDLKIEPVDDYTQWKQALQSEIGTDPATFEIADGFEIDLLRSATKQEGSWVSLAFDSSGRIVIAKESKGLLRFTLAEQDGGHVQVEVVNDSLEECRGLLFAHGCLFANANNSKGLYRLRDTDGDDTFDEVRLLYESAGGVGHGRNDLALGPDGLIYSIHGDSVELPSDCRDLTSPAREARRGTKTSEGHVIRMDSQGQHQELVLGGLRNPFGIDFNPDGEMFTYDADAEFDMGSPWYRPTRVQHLLPGGDYGWRGVTKQWPPYFPDHPDAAPPNLDLGKGSPTAVKFGTESHFPDVYRRALFVLDWAYGRIVAIHFSARGASYVGRAETFLRGRPLNVTDLAFGPDGAMYFVTGGRNTQSALYRVRYAKRPKRVATKDVTITETAQQIVRAEHARRQRELRKRLEQYHGTFDRQAVDFAWPYLNHSDPWLRHAARIAIEHQPIEQWAEQALSESRRWASLTALMALAARGDSVWCDRVVRRLCFVPLEALTTREKLIVLRAYEICFEHDSLPEGDERSRVVRQLDTLYPDVDWRVNREVSRLMARLNCPSLVTKTMGLLRDATEQHQQLHYLFVLRNQTVGWTPEVRDEYFRSFRLAADYVRGEGMEGFVQQIQTEALATVPEERRTEISRMLATKRQDHSDASNSSRPFVHAWTVEDFDFRSASENAPDLERGKHLFTEVQCASCHRFGKQGRAVGPDLTSVGRRFSAQDVLRSIVEPSNIVAEKYRKDVLEISDGRTLLGTVSASGDYRSPTLRIIVNARLPNEAIEIAKSDIVSHTKSTQSQMPEGLLNTLRHDEILDLLAYLLSGEAEAELRE